MAKNKDYTALLKKIVNSLQNLINVNREHKKISEKQLKKSMNPWEQRIWNIAQIIVLILLSIGITVFISKIFHTNEQIPDYLIDINDNPNKI